MGQKPIYQRMGHAELDRFAKAWRSGVYVHDLMERFQISSGQVFTLAARLGLTDKHQAETDRRKGGAHHAG